MKPATVPLEADVVVIGGGGAGLIAAVAAAREGAAVVLIEKGDRIGGTTLLSVGSIMAAGTTYQKAAGISDSADAHAAELSNMAAAHGFELDPELIKMFTENSAGTIAFLNTLGVNFLGPLPQPPFAISRMHQVMPGSRAYIDRLEQAARQLGVQFLLKSRAAKLLRDNNRVLGIEATGPANELIEIKARRAVILASGDMSANSTLMRKFIPAWPEDVSPMNPLCTGDGHLMGAEIGGQIVRRPRLGPQHILNLRFLPPPRLTFVQKVPVFAAFTAAMAWAVQHLPAFVIKPFVRSFLTGSMVPDPQVYEAGAILVDTQGGKISDWMSAGIQVAKLPKKQCYVILDERLAKKFNNWPHFFATAPGVAYAYFKDFQRSRPDLVHTAYTLAELGCPSSEHLAQSGARISGALASSGG
jgi:hypothetical protein